MCKQQANDGRSSLPDCECARWVGRGACQERHHVASENPFLVPAEGAYCTKTAGLSVRCCAGRDRHSIADRLGAAGGPCRAGSDRPSQGRGREGPCLARDGMVNATSP
jgi:hypothetical protein